MLLWRVGLRKRWRWSVGDWNHWASRILKPVARTGPTALKHPSGHRASANVEPCCIFSASPLQLAPPYCGDGLVHVHVWFLFWDPPPHVWEQGCHSDHEAQPPSTDKQQRHKSVTNSSDGKIFNYVLYNLNTYKIGWNKAHKRHIWYTQTQKKKNK